MKTYTLFVILIAFALTLSACGTTAANPQPTTAATIAPTATPASIPTIEPTTAPSTKAAIRIAGFNFSPATLTIKAGTTVTWTNQDGAEHIVEADDQSFVSDSLENGSSYSFTFDTAGTFTYHCGIHSSMKGTIIVTP